MSSSASPATRFVVLAGNPNCGKSTLFNALTGGNAGVGNFPGTTVSINRGRCRLESGADVDVHDVPGLYSLASASPDERVALDAMVGAGTQREPDALIVVADAPRLARSLYLVLQALELDVPVMVVVNLLDEAASEGLDLDLNALSAALGVPVVGTVARSGVGIEGVRTALADVLNSSPPSPVMTWPEPLAADTARVAANLPDALQAIAPSASERRLALARWLLLSADVEGRAPGFEQPVEVVLDVRSAAVQADRDLVAELVAARYAWIDARSESWCGRTPVVERSWTERLDRWALHPLAGSLSFLLIMGVAFTALFAWADPLIGWVEGGVGLLGERVAAGFDALAPAMGGGAQAWMLLRDLIVEGVIAGVGAVLVFLPQIALLFFFLALLEDCGYLARAAHLADRVLRSAGLPGRAFVPLLAGYACAVPAILATRTMPRFRDRLVTMMVLPLTSCSARLPVYTLLIAALFPATAFGFVPLRPLALAGMYLFSTLLTLAAALVVGRTVFASKPAPALLELPPYRVPDPGVVFRIVSGRCKDFLREAGGIILVATIVLWGLLSFPRLETTDDAPVAQAVALEHSYGGRLGKTIEPVIEPLGYDWQIGVGLVGAFAAREVFVSTMGMVYGVGADAEATSPELRERIRQAKRPDGTPTYTPLVGLSIMVFFAIALQCLSTLAVLKKETRTWRWPVFAFVWMGALAWCCAFIVYQGGRALGFT